MDAEALDYQRQRQAGRIRQIQVQVAQFEQSMKAMQQQVASFERGQQRSAAQSEEWGNILTGITPTVDPMGNRQDVWTGTKSRYFKNEQAHHRQLRRCTARWRLDGAKDAPAITNRDCVSPGGGAVSGE